MVMRFVQKKVALCSDLGVRRVPAKHMSTMKKEMSNGKTFTAAHKIAMR